MSTNYYVTLPAVPCPTCGRHTQTEEVLHLGKSSAGWVFSLHIYPERNIHTLSDWLRVLGAGAKVHNEYKELVSLRDLLSVIMLRTGSIGQEMSDSFLAANCAERGPLGLARVRIGGGNKHCVSHGDGTWSCFVGDFS